MRLPVTTYACVELHVPNFEVCRGIASIAVGPRQTGQSDRVAKGLPVALPRTSSGKTVDFMPQPRLENQWNQPTDQSFS